MERKVFMVENKGKWYGYTKEMLTSPDNNGDTWKSVEGSLKEDGSEIYSKGYGTTIVGTWKHINVKDEWLDADNRWVEDRITDKKAPFKRDQSRWDASVLERGVASWTLTDCKPEYKPTEEGLAQMPLKLSQLVKGIVVMELYGDPDDPLYQMASSEH